MLYTEALYARRVLTGIHVRVFKLKNVLNREQNNRPRSVSEITAVAKAISPWLQLWWLTRQIHRVTIPCYSEFRCYRQKIIVSGDTAIIGQYVIDDGNFDYTGFA